nr:unnamed protein product [Haemonchus contortus]
MLRSRDTLSKLHVGACPTTFSGIVFSMGLQSSSENPQKRYNSISDDKKWASDRQHFENDFFMFSECGLLCADIVNNENISCCRDFFRFS